MRYFFDTEFFDDGHTIELISIGMVADDGREYYAETEIARDLISSGQYIPRMSNLILGCPQWHMDNVVPHLVGSDALKRRSMIAADLINFCNKQNDWPEFWAYYAAYDWVALCQLFGPMILLPVGWPKHCRDLKQLVGRAKLPAKPLAAQSALADARWVKECFDAWLNGGAKT